MQRFEELHDVHSKNIEWPVGWEVLGNDIGSSLKLLVKSNKWMVGYHMLKRVCPEEPSDHKKRGEYRKFQQVLVVDPEIQTIHGAHPAQARSRVVNMFGWGVGGSVFLHRAAIWEM